MSRLDKLENEMTKLKSETGKKKKPFKFPGKIKSLSKKSQKTIDQVLVQYLTQKQEIKFKLCKIIGGNVIVVNNKVHELNPQRTWRYGKHLWYIIKEIDRNPVSNEDYDRIKARGDDTDADVPLLKAVLGAIQKKPTGGIGGKGLWIGIAIAIVILIVIFSFLS